MLFLLDSKQFKKGIKYLSKKKQNILNFPIDRMQSVLN